MVRTDVLQRKRIRTLLVLFSIGILLLLIFRVGYWQIIKADWLRQRAADQWLLEIPAEAGRGDILDRNGNILASSVSCDSVVLHPNAIDQEDLDTVVAKLSQILGIDEETVRRKATSSNYSVVWLKRQITAEQAQQIIDSSLPGVSLTEDKTRYYPMGNFLTQVLGFTSVDGEGLEGLEARFNNYLKGIPGSVVFETDRDGNELPGSYEQFISPVDGNNIQLTIDVTLQSYAEQAMELCCAEQFVDRVMCIIMDPRTGEILAMVNKPDFDNNNPPRNDISLLTKLVRNGSISDVYEPGSTFKVVTLASALDAGVVSINSSFYCPSYKIVDGQKIKCWSVRSHGSQNLTQAAQNSCNPAFMTMALDMGIDTFYDYIYDFGFGSVSGLQLYGEASGIVTSQKYVKNVDIARIGFGQSIAITPLQLANAVSAAVNGGNLMQPYIIKNIISNDGEVIQSFEPAIIRNVISEQTSQTVRDILHAVVENGSGRNAKIEGYAIGGKTGTAQKYGENGAILPDEHISSFVGIAPIDNPRLVVLVVADNPKAGSSYGSIVAAPYVKMILENALPYLNIMPDIETGDEELAEVPDVRDMEAEEAINRLESNGFHYIIEGYSGRVVAQVPAPGVKIEKHSNVVILLENEDDQNQDMLVVVPDLYGLSAIEANNLLVENHLQLKILGSGNTVVSQSPAAGETAYFGDVITVTFEYVDKTDEDDNNN